MEALILFLLFIGLLIGLYVLGVPVAIAMGTTALIVMISPFGSGIRFATISTQMLHGLNSFSLLAVPFYLLLGRVMNRTGFTNEIFDLANMLVGRYRGGIAHVNILASMVFSGMSGVAVADAAGLGRIEYTAMREHGYSKGLSVGVTGSSAIIGPIIPPSVALIIYGLLTGVSIGQLFIAGIVPGVLLGLSLMIFVLILVGRNENPTGGEQDFTVGGVLGALKSSSPALLIPFIVVVGILTGQFTATEAGAVAVGYTILIGYLKGELNLNILYEEFRDSMVETYSLLFIVAMAAFYGLVALQVRIPMLLMDAISGVSTGSLVTIFLICGMFLIIGTFMEAVAAMTVLVPILGPTVQYYSLDPLHLGIIIVLTLMLGALTPPLGIILFVLEQVTDASLEEIIKGVIPFYAPILAVIVLCILFPDLILYLPQRFI